MSPGPELNPQPFCSTNHCTSMSHQNNIEEYFAHIVSAGSCEQHANISQHQISIVPIVDQKCSERVFKKKKHIKLRKNKQCFHWTGQIFVLFICTCYTSSHARSQCLKLSSKRSSGVMQGILEYTEYAHLFFSQHCVYLLLNVAFKKGVLGRTAHRRLCLATVSLQPRWCPCLSSRGGGGAGGALPGC